MPTALITGAAGFIGFFAAQRLLKDDYCVVGLDWMSDYYHVSLKEARLALLEANPDFRHVFGKVEDSCLLMKLF